MPRTLALLLCLPVLACSDDGTEGDTGPSLDQTITTDATVPTDGPAGLDGPGQTDGAPPADGPQGTDAGAWNCTLQPGGGSFTNPHADGCKWDWSCPDVGDRQLYCETVSTASYTCSCKNVTAGTVDKTFTSTAICGFSKQAIPAQANLNCGWNLPTQ